VQLLQRTTRKLSLTDAERAFFERARAGVANLEEATAAASEHGTEPRGTVRITAPVDLGVMMLGDIVTRFVRKHPHIHVELAMTGRTVDLVEEGFDLAVRAGRLADSTLIARKLGETTLGVFAAPAYLRRRGRPKSVADLARHDCVLFRGRASRATWSLSGPDGIEEVEVTGAINADDLGVVRSALLAGAGLGLIPMFLALQQAPQLEHVLPGHAVHGAPLHVVTPGGRHEPARVTLFREFLTAALLKVRWSC
jgi:DNA-binding transcriptional LysR family regulator